MQLIADGEAYGVHFWQGVVPHGGRRQTRVKTLARLHVGQCVHVAAVVGAARCIAVGPQGEALFNPHDTPNAQTGRRLALQRAIEQITHGSLTTREGRTAFWAEYVRAVGIVHDGPDILGDLRAGVLADEDLAYVLRLPQNVKLLREQIRRALKGARAAGQAAAWTEAYELVREEWFVANDDIRAIVERLIRERRRAA